MLHWSPDPLLSLVTWKWKNFTKHVYFLNYWANATPNCLWLVHCIFIKLSVVLSSTLYECVWLLLCVWWWLERLWALCVCRRATVPKAQCESALRARERYTKALYKCNPFTIGIKSNILFCPKGKFVSISTTSNNLCKILLIEIELLHLHWATNISKLN